MPNMTTPTEREREAARTVYDSAFAKGVHDKYQIGFICNAIATALAQARREGEREQMERDCKAVCNHCADGVMPINGSGDAHYYYDLGERAFVECGAEFIRSAYAAALEALRGSGESVE